MARWEALCHPSNYLLFPPVSINRNIIYKGHKQICTLYSYVYHRHTNRDKDVQPCITVSSDIVYISTKFQPSRPYAIKGYTHS